MFVVVASAAASAVAVVGLSVAVASMSRLRVSDSMHSGIMPVIKTKVKNYYITKKNNTRYFEQKEKRQP